MLDERGLRRQVGLLFAVVVVAFIGVNLVVVLAMRPQLHRVANIYGTLGDSLHLLARMRGAAADIRATTTLAALGGDRAHELAGAPSEIDGHLARLVRLGSEYERLGTEPEETRAWQTLRDREIPELAARARAVVDAEARGGAPAAMVHDLIAHSVAVDALLQELAQVNTTLVQRSAATIHSSLIRLLALCGALLVLGGVGASLLAVRALSLIRVYAASTERRLQELDAFASRVAHDLRSPLQTLLLALAGISRKSADEGIRASAERAERGVQRLNAMISDLLEFARSGATPEPGSEAEVAATFEDVQGELGPVAEKAGVTLSLRADGDLWVAASSAALRSIVANLVENGIKYAQPNGERRVETLARAEGRRVRLEVRDTGLGITRERLPTIFDPFVRARDRRDSYGLGLATVKRLVDAHGGTVAVESVEGRGTTFVVDLPRVLHLPVP